MASFPKFTYIHTSSPNATWQPGDGASSDDWKKYKKIEIDPYGHGRPKVNNYKTLCSAIVPRPIGFISTVSESGVANLAPFSYFNVAHHDPPLFTIGISSMISVKDTCDNILKTKELTINIISEWFAEAANYCAIDAPADADEWELSGLTPAKSSVVKPPHVAESAFSVEAKLIHHHEWHSKDDPTKVNGYLLIVEGVRFHAREDVISEDQSVLDINKLKPVSRLGGITYGTTQSGYDLAKPLYKE